MALLKLMRVQDWVKNLFVLLPILFWLATPRTGADDLPVADAIVLAGLAFLAWLDGRQANPMLVNHEERSRPPERLLEYLAIAAAAGTLEDVAGVEQRLARIGDVARGRPSGLGDLAGGAAGIRRARGRS